MKHVFVILHFLNGIDTEACVESILKLKTPRTSEMVIVDNGSNNDSYSDLKKKFINYPTIHFLQNSTNLGFAKGNNVGYRYAKEKLGADFISIINNDTLIEQNDYVDTIFRVFEETDFAVLGPDIISLVDRVHQNPLEEKPLSPQKTLKEIKRYRLLLLLSRLGLYDKLKRKKERKRLSVKSLSFMEQRDNVVLHGSALTFSPRFLEKFTDCFDERTFMYMEEMILFMKCQIADCKMLYCPEVTILHKEDSATDKYLGTGKKKREFIFKNMIASLKVYLKVLSA